MSLTDPHGRTIDYLRVSVTDRCNLNCVYCRPSGLPFLPENEYLTQEEILTVCRQAALLGIRHIRITGGEPLVREDCCSILAALKRLPGIETVTLTTNGILLRRYLKELHESGIDGLNISLDTLDKKRYQALTGADRLDEVMAGIREAAALKIPVKLNCVTMAEPDAIVEPGAVNDDSGSAQFGAGNSPESAASQENSSLQGFFRLAELARRLPVDVRFIEAMPVGENSCAPFDHRALIDAFLSRCPGMERTEEARGFGPAVYYRIPGFSGCIGFISAIHGNFCQNCNRIRMTSEGVLKSCLSYKGNICLKPLFQETDPEQAIRGALLFAVSQKPPRHRFDEPDFHPGTETMSKIGG